jgi:hypothetical protein
MANDLQQQADDAIKWDGEREKIATELATAQGNAFELTERITLAHKLMDQELRAGTRDSVSRASEHGMAIGSMQLTMQRQQSVIEQLTNAFAAVPQSDISQSDIDSIRTLRRIALDPEASWQHLVPALTPDPADELRRLGQFVAEQERLGRYFVNQPRPMIDTR